MFSNFLGYCEKHHFLSKTVVAPFWVLFGKYGLIFSPSSGDIGPTLMAFTGVTITNAPGPNQS